RGGAEHVWKIVEGVRTRLGNDSRPELVRDTLKAEIARILEAATRAPADSGDAPLVIMMVGVNGVGKTTTVAKLAARLKAERGSGTAAAAAPFPAAAIAPRKSWCAPAAA